MPDKNQAQIHLDDILARTRPSRDEIDALRKLEREAPARFGDASAALDRRYKHVRLDRLAGRPLETRAAIERVDSRPRTAPATLPASALLAKLFGDKLIRCNCMVPFMFQRLDAVAPMSGPDRTGVANGVLGALRVETGQYEVDNTGDTEGKTRVPRTGQLDITFAASLGAPGRYCLIVPSGMLSIRGRTRVVGHGNATTSYDAKVAVDYYQLLTLDDGSAATLLELDGVSIHADGTRSEDRTQSFSRDLELPARYLFIDVDVRRELTLALRLQVHTEANEDGIAIGIVDEFGFLANSSHDCDTFAIRTA